MKRSLVVKLMLKVATVRQIKFPVVLVLISLSLCDCVQIDGDLNTRFSLIFFSLIEDHFFCDRCGSVYERFISMIVNNRSSVGNENYV